MSGVEAHSSLPHDQNDRGNLPGQGQPRHFRPHAFSQQFRIELREGTGLARGDDRRSLEKIFQIMIVISVQPANLDLLLFPFELSFYNMVISAAARLDTDTAIGP
jgi:hypothetical protein